MCSHGLRVCVPHVLQDAFYSSNETYAPPSKRKGESFMFCARVAIGVYGQGTEGMPVPPPLSNPTGDAQPMSPHSPGNGQGAVPKDQLCDSTVNKMDNPTIFVAYHDGQAYPEYLITFKRKN